MRPAESHHAIARDAEIARVLDAVRWVLGGAARSKPVQRAVFPERLLALRHVEAIAAGSRELCVAPGTVVTPLARDELKRRGITVRWISRNEVEAVSRRGEWAFVIEGEGGVLSALRRTWLDGAETWRELAALSDAVRWVAESDERGVLVVTEQAAVAVWRANQVAGIRAASAETSAAVDRAVRSLGVNLLAVEPDGKPLPLLKQLAATFRSAGAPRIPESLFEEPAPCVSPK